MRKSTLILGLGVVAMLASRSLAQDSTMWFDVRDNDLTHGGAGGANGQFITAGAPASPYINGQEPPAGGGSSTNRFGTAAINAGARGAGEILRLNPQQNSGFHTTPNPNGAGSAWPNYARLNGDGTFTAADTNSSTGSLYLYLDVADDVSGTGDVMSSLGFDTLLANGPNLITARNTISCLAFTMFNGAAVAGASPAVPWNATPVDGASNGAPLPSIIGSKAVRVPVTSPAAYAATLGLQAGGPYRIGRLDVCAGTRNCTQRSANIHVDNSTYGVKLSVNNLLITRVFQSGGDAVENVSMGYDPLAGAGTLEAPVSGSVTPTPGSGAVGIANNALDAAVQIRLHGDFNGDGNVTAIDIAGFNAAVAASSGGTIKVSQMYLGDFNNNRTVTAIDISAFNKAIAASPTCP